MCQESSLVLIDDEPGVLRALTLLLQTLGYRIAPFSSPRDAVKYVTSGNPVDAVVTDLRMPEISGEQVLAELRLFSMDLPIIIMSGHASHQDQAILTKNGASGFIQKPFTPSQFKAALALASPALTTLREKQLKQNAV